MKLESRLRAIWMLMPASAALASPASAQFYGDPPDETHPWAVHDTNRPQPPRVESGKTPGAPPSDATVLFDGSSASLSNWEPVSAERKGDWVVKDNTLQCTPGAGYIQTKERFGDCQLHVEWTAPVPVHGDGQGRGNSGIFLMGLTEVQVLDNYDNPTYPDGFAGAVYGVMPPMANPLRKPGEWQTYDIIFRRPIVENGEVLDQGSLTVFVNGVLVQDHTPLEGGGGHKTRSHPKAFPETGPLQLQDHGNPVRFRNIWFRHLRRRAVDGGTDGQLSREATAAKRAQIAAAILQDAATRSGTNRLLRLMESLCYRTDDAAEREIAGLGTQWLARIKVLPADRLDSQKNEILQINNAIHYLVRHKRMPAGTPLENELAAILKSHGWDGEK